MAKNVLRNPGRAFDISAKIATPAASRNPKAALSPLLKKLNFLLHRDKGIPGKNCIIFAI